MSGERSSTYFEIQHINQKNFIRMEDFGMICTTYETQMFLKLLEAEFHFLFKRSEGSREKIDSATEKIIKKERNLVFSVKSSTSRFFKKKKQIQKFVWYIFWQYPRHFYLKDFCTKSFFFKRWSFEIEALKAEVPERKNILNFINRVYGKQKGLLCQRKKLHIEWWSCSQVITVDSNGGPVHARRHQSGITFYFIKSFHAISITNYVSLTKSSVAWKTESSNHYTVVNLLFFFIRKRGKTGDFFLLFIVFELK